MAAVKIAKYILTDVGNNNNKFWTIIEEDDGNVTTHWGRVGEDGQKQCVRRPPGFFEQKCREKEKKGYTILNVIDNGGVSVKTVQHGELASIAAKQIRTNSSEVDKLVRRLAEVNVHNILHSTKMTYDTDSGLFQTPLGIITTENITDARKLLEDISKVVVARDWGRENFNKTVSDYMRLVPMDIGRRRVELRDIFSDIEDVRKQNDILDSLETSLAMVKVKPMDDTQQEIEQIFDVRLEIVENPKIIDHVKKRFVDSLNSRHLSSSLRVKRVFEVDIRTVREAFEAKGRPVGNVQELWHGTKIANVLSILKQGLIIPPSNASYCTGRMFGNGIYSSDQSTKALNYASGGTWGGRFTNNCFMFLMDVAMGKPYTPSGYNEHLPKPGYDSTFAEARRSGVSNNEMIVYKTYQADLKYLVEFE